MQAPTGTGVLSAMADTVIDHLINLMPAVDAKTQEICDCPTILDDICDISPVFNKADANQHTRLIKTTVFLLHGRKGAECIWITELSFLNCTDLAKKATANWRYHFIGSATSICSLRGQLVLLVNERLVGPVTDRNIIPNLFNFHSPVTQMNSAIDVDYPSTVGNGYNISAAYHDWDNQDYYTIHDFLFTFNSKRAKRSDAIRAFALGLEPITKRNSH
jgi:hypothetical protein